MVRPDLILIDGVALAVTWAEDQDGKVPALEFFQVLAPQEKAQILAFLKRLAQRGRLQSADMQRVEEGLWEIWRGPIGLFGVFPRRGLFVVMWGIKSEDRLDAREKAKNFVGSWLACRTA